MKYLFIILIVVFYSCKQGNRLFFQNLKPVNPFLDTFSLSNLRGFGISDNLILRQGKSYYDFNSSNNAIYIGSAFRENDGKLFYLPTDSEKELLFLDSHWSKIPQVKSNHVKAKNNDVYEVKWLGLNYNSKLRDSTFNIQIDGDGIFNHPESLIFEVSRSFDILTIDHVNCKHDTLTISFFPKQRMYFKSINKFAVCL